MSFFDVIAILLALVALFAYVNQRVLRLQPSVGVMVLALAFSLGLVLLSHLGCDLRPRASQILHRVDFTQALLHWMLGFLLFAGALGIDAEELLRHKLVVLALAIGSTIVSTGLIGGLMFVIFRAVGLGVPLPATLVLGAIISPTDPVAVLGLLKWLRAPIGLQTIIGAESLLNDGVGVVLFLTLLGYAHGGDVTVAGAVWLFFREAIGGAVLGGIGGIIVDRLLRREDTFQVQVLLTVAMVMALSAIAERLGVSGPLAAVFAGLIVGRHTSHSQDRASEPPLLRFWELLDELLNAVLFVLIGLNVLLIPFTTALLLAAALAVPAVLAARYVSVVALLATWPAMFRAQRRIIPVLLWGGLRGGLAVAMALSLPGDFHREPFVAVTYGIVLFSILVQGTTSGRVIRRCLPCETGPSDLAAAR